MSDPIHDAMVAARIPPHVGKLKGPVGGRTDHLAVSVPPEAFVIPADVVSGLGEGNTENGHAILDAKFPQKREHGPGVPIMAASGEHVLGPKVVEQVGDGDIKRGHKVLEAFVLHARAQTIKDMRGLKGPHK